MPPLKHSVEAAFCLWKTQTGAFSSVGQQLDGVKTLLGPFEGPALLCGPEKVELRLN